MYTRCPECRTPFKITRAQLAARAGLVRCGRCGAVFRAHEQLLEIPDGSSVENASSRRRRRKSTKTRADGDPGIPTISELSFAPRRRRLHPLLWVAANLALFLVLAWQAIYFYRQELAQYSTLAPFVREFCRHSGCHIEIRPLPPPELSETTIAPHPRFANGLRIRAVMVNRTRVPLPFPLMEVSLTDSAGTPLARRTFQPRQYLEKPAAAGRMEPNVAVRALVDVTNPSSKAVGYEIRLLSPDETPQN